MSDSGIPRQVAEAPTPDGIPDQNRGNKQCLQRASRLKAEISEINHRQQMGRVLHCWIQGQYGMLKTFGRCWSFKNLEIKPIHDELNQSSLVFLFTTASLLTMTFFISAYIAVVAFLFASSNAEWTKESFKHGVYFGDSYTDTGRGMGSKPSGWTEPAVS
jgi:hypothetical protein